MLTPLYFELVEAKDQANGEAPVRWRVLLAKAGISHNGNHYPLEVLHQSARLFEGVRALARDDDQHVRGLGKNVGSLVGWIENVKPTPAGLEGVFVAEAKWLRDKIWNAWNLGKKDYIGLSLVAKAQIGRTMRDGAGRLVRMIQGIKEVDFVDTIVTPSAGGAILGLAEALGQPNGRLSLMNVDKLLSLIKRKDPAAYAQIDQSNIDEDQVVQIFEAIVEREESGDPATPAATPAAPTTPAAPAATSTPPTGATLEQVRQVVSEAIQTVTSGFESQRARERSETMLTTMVAESDLPAGSAPRILQRFAEDAPMTREQIAEAITDEQEYLGRNRFRGPGSQVVVECTADELDRWSAAMEGFFTGQAMPINGDEKNLQAPFVSIKEAYVEMTGDVHVTGMIEDAFKVGRTAEAAITSSTFGEALGSVMHRQLQREYQMAPFDQWKMICTEVPVNDFRTNKRAQLGGFSQLTSVGEGVDYTAFATEPDDFSATYAVTKYGRIQELTLETIVNDDVGVVLRMPRKMARAAMSTLNTNAWAPIINNSNWTGDDAALCSAGRGNYTTSAFAPATIAAGRLAMMKQTEPQSGDRLLLKPRFAAVPVDLEQQAREWLGSDSKPQVDRSTAATTENERVLNFLKSEGIIPLVIPHATDVNNCWLFANPDDVAMVEIGYLGNKREPELFVQDMPNVGSMFNADKITYKIRHIYGVCVLDFRGFYMFNVT